MSEGAKLLALLQAAGDSLSAAQDRLGQEAQLPTAVAISEVDLEVKTGLAATTSGDLVLQTISAKDMRESAFDAGLVSTVRARLVAVPAAEPAAVAPPRRTLDQVTAEVAKRPDVATLIKVLDDVRLDAVFVPEAGRWLVTAVDADGRLLREVVVADQPATRKG